MTIRVERPERHLRDAFFRMLDDYAVNDPANGRAYALAANDDFGGYVDDLLADESRVEDPSEYAPCSHRWLVDDDGEIAGIVRVRHDGGCGDLEDEVGHIGYDVPPSRRGRGHGVLCLRAGLRVAGEIGLDEVVVLAEACNVASWRTIERCGGVLDRTCRSGQHAGEVRRYRVRVPKGGHFEQWSGPY